MKEFLKQYIPYYKDYKKEFFLAIVGMVMVSVGTSGTAYSIKPILDDIFINKDEDMLKLLPFLVIFLYFLKGFGKYLNTYYISFIGTDIIRRVKDKFLGHILSLDIEFFQKKHGGELISRINNDTLLIQNAVSNDISTLVRESFTILALLFVVIYQSPTLAFYSLVVLPLFLYPLVKFAKKMKKISHSTQEKTSILISILGEIFNNIEMILANNAQEQKQKKFSKANQEVVTLFLKGIKINALVSPLMEIIGSIAAAVVILIGGKEVIDGNLTVGEFFSFLTALFMLYTPIKVLSATYNKFQEAIAANERINSIFALENKIKGGKKELDFKIDNISIKNVSLYYDKKIALDNVSLDVKKGDFVAFVGDSGAGKSSFVNIFLRFYDFSGKVLFNGIDIKEFTIESVRKNIAIVTQKVYILNDTIAKNVYFGNEFDEERVKKALKLAYALDFVEEMGGIYTILDEFGSNLSGGQRQRIAIARALYKNPQILIFDEATSALDNESESMITKVINNLRKDKIIFTIAHRLSTIKDANKIVVFKSGKIVCIGSEDELSNCKEYIKLKNLSQ